MPLSGTVTAVRLADGECLSGLSKATRICAIYGLRDPLTQEIRYISKSINVIGRYFMHVHTARHPDKWATTTHLYNWLRSILPHKPELVIMEEAPKEQLPDLEMKWIAHGRKLGWPLTNISPGGDGSHCPPGCKCRKHHPETRAAIARTRLEGIASGRIPKPTGGVWTEERRRAQSEYMKNRYAADPEYRAKISRQGWRHTKESREKIRQSMKEQYAAGTITDVPDQVEPTP